jgi:hypothetical protein
MGRPSDEPAYDGAHSTARPPHVVGARTIVVLDSITERVIGREAVAPSIAVEGATALGGLRGRSVGKTISFMIGTSCGV